MTRSTLLVRTQRTALVAVAVLAAMAIARPAAADPVDAIRAPETTTVSKSDREQRTPPIVRAWRAAWLSDDPQQLASLFTRDGVYVDQAFEVSWSGRPAIAQWKAITDASITDIGVEITATIRQRDRIAIEWTFSGTIIGAPASFAVPATTIQRLDGRLIASNTDYYNLAAVLRQSGLPADWSPAG